MSQELQRDSMSTSRWKSAATDSAHKAAVVSQMRRSTKRRTDSVADGLLIRRCGRIARAAWQLTTKTSTNGASTLSRVNSAADWAAWHPAGGPVGPPSRWAATSNVEVGQTT